MAVAPYGEKLDSLLESIGPVEARRLKLQNHFHSEDWQALDRWLAIEEVKSKARAELRDEEHLSIARKALLLDSKALRFTIITAIIALIAIVVDMRFQLSEQAISWFLR